MPVAMQDFNPSPLIIQSPPDVQPNTSSSPIIFYFSSKTNPEHISHDDSISPLVQTGIGRSQRAITKPRKFNDYYCYNAHSSQSSTKYSLHSFLSYHKFHYAFLN